MEGKSFKIDVHRKRQRNHSPEILEKPDGKAPVTRIGLIKASNPIKTPREELKQPMGFGN